MADKISMNTQDAVSANFAECFVTLNGTRYSMLMAKEFEGKASINTKEVYRLGNPVIGHKAQTIALAFSMTVYKCTEIFDQVVEDFIKTGVMPTFDIQTSNDDPATSVGRSTKIYNNCVLDGDVLLSMFNAEGDFVEQTLEGYERITNGFILDNYASQKGKGLHFGLDRLRGFFTEYWNKYRTAEGWVLKADVRHFFASIDHDKLKEKLKKLDLEPIVFDLLCTYIDSTDGLPLGYQTSQLFALLFLDEFDHFVKERLHIRWYGRYMDDFFLIHPDKDYLQFCLKEIRAFMASLGLELNEKTQIFPIRNGIDFLGFHTYLTEEGKVIRKLRHSSIKRMRSKLRRWEQDYPAGLVTREKILQSWQAWDAHAAHGNTWSLRQQVRDRVQNILKEEI